MYRCVVPRSRWPASFCTARAGAPRIERCEQNVCRICRARHKRHRFAIRTLVHWYRTGLEVDPLLPLLATYLGHVHVHETYWYLEAVPELLALATERLVDRQQEVAP